MQNQNPFSSQALTKPISVTDASGTSSSTVLPAVGNSIRIVNEGPNTAFVSVGVGAQVATLPNSTPTATSTPILAGTDITLTLPGPFSTAALNSTSQSAALFIAAVCRSGGTALLDVQVGEGV